MVDKEVIGNILEAVGNNGSFFITSHIRPDGDAMGSQLALMSFLKRQGKSVLAASPDRIPQIYRFLSGQEDFQAISRVEEDFDVAFILDCPSLVRTGDIIDVSRRAKTVVNIDHHVDNLLFGNINYVKKEASSVSELIYNVIMQSSQEMTKAEAECLYVGIFTDTSRFQESNASAESHSIAADLIRRGVSVTRVTDMVYRSMSVDNVRLLQKVLETLELSEDKRIASLVVKHSMLEETGTTSEDTEGIVEYTRNMKGVDVGILFREIQNSGKYKVSFRSRRNMDVNRVAKLFDGGGHKNAAGCTVEGAIGEVKEKVIKAVAGALH